jgi:transposase
VQLKLTSPKIYLATQAVDFRRSIDGLSEIIHANFMMDLKGSIFVFYSRDRKKLKLLTWHRNGFILIYKRLEKGCFKLSLVENQLTILDEKQLSWLLAGLDWVGMSDWKELEFEHYY